MTRITGFANHTAREAVDTARKALSDARTLATLWLDRYAASDQMDDDDRRAIEKARKVIEQLHLPEIRY
jgi:Flp pilus assembly protein TadD